MTITVILTGLLLSGFFSGAEIGIYRANRLRLHLAVRRGDAGARRLARLLDDEQAALSCTLIGTNAANYATTTAVAYAFAHLLGLGDDQVQFYTIVLVTPVIFVFGEVVPKNLFQLHADALMSRTSRFLSATQRAFRALGLIALSSGFARIGNRLAGGVGTRGRAVDPRRRMAQLLQEALAGQDVSDSRSLLVDRVVQLSERPVRSMMIPLRRVITIHAESDLSELIRVAEANEFVRLPVVDSRGTRVVGVLKVDKALRDDQWKIVQERATAALTLPPNEIVASAIRRMRDARQELAVVADAAGRCLGVVTMRDLLQGIIGDVRVEGRRDR
ncbi:MAG: CNNM domain-containing protein [Planctomycetota bacterium]